MSSGSPTKPLAAAMALAGAVLLAASPALAADPTPNPGNTAWLMTSALLVLLMTIPGLALFYGGLVRTKNMLSMLMQVFFTVCIVAVIWVLYGYSLTFTEGKLANGIIGSFDKAFLKGITPDSMAASFSAGVPINEYAYIAFQMTFACITPALIVGAMAERMRFKAIFLFVPLWVTLVYFPVAHMVWYWAGPDDIAKAAKAVVDAGSDAAKKAAAQTALDAVNANAGMLFKWGAIDFAGGTVVHINAGIAGLVGALIVGKRVGYGREAMAPHSLTMTVVGAALLWVGWFGFNAGSALEANGTAALAMINTFAATAAAGLAWMVAELFEKGKPSMLGLVSGVVAGLVAVTPAAGYAGPMGSLCLGLVAGAVCFVFCSSIKNRIGYDDALDVFGVHCVGGIIGAIGTGILVAPSLGGSGLFDYEAGKVAETFVMSDQVIKQVKAVGFTLIWSAVGSAILFKLVDIVVGLRASTDQEREGLDINDHGERAYNY